MAGLATKAPFRVGAKEVFLPNFIITMVNTPRLPPNFAKFIVPLSMNKLDFRDYLYHAYNVRIVSVRSYIQQQDVQQGKTNAPRPTLKRWHRPRAIKKMTVELEQPFVFPTRPEDLTEWGQATFAEARRDNEKYQEKTGRLADAMYDEEDRQSVSAQARLLLQGKEVWKPANDFGRAK